jgi:hypothetical protein
MERFPFFARALRTLAICTAALVISVMGLLAYCEHRNARDVPPPSEAELRDHFKRAADWLFANSARVSSEDNPMLWVFVWEAARLTGDTHLQAMANDYRERYVKGTISQFFSTRAAASSSPTGLLSSATIGWTTNGCSSTAPPATTRRARTPKCRPY